jgi:putative ABC transport system ATP-binding protein
LVAERSHLLASMSAVAGAFALVLFFEAVFAGESEQIVAYIKRTDADVWVMQEGVSNMHMATSFVWDWKADRVAEVAGVRRVTPILYLNTVMEAGDRNWFSFIVGLEEGDARAGPWAGTAGKTIPGPGEVIVPAVLGSMAGLSLEDEVGIGGETFTVAGFSEGTFSMANSVAFVTMSDLSDVMSSFGSASYLLVDAETGVDPTDLAARIQEAVDKVSVLPSERFVDNDWEVAMQMGLEIISLMTLIGGSLAILLTGFTVYVSVSRKERELAVIKALGFRNRAVYMSAMVQAAVIATGGFSLAVAVVWLAVPITAAFVPQVTLQVIPEALFRVGLIALGVAVLSSMLPVRKLVRVEPTLHAAHLVKTFGTGHAAVRAVDDVSIDVKPGELVVIMGPSGSGKTTLVSMLGALLSPDSGTITFEGAEIAGLDEAGLAEVRARKIGFIFQSFNLLEALTVEQNVLFPASLVPGGLEAARPRAERLLEQLGMTSRRSALPKTLSGGEQQRVAIARALINEPRLILADEPTGNLDSQSGQEVTMVLHDVARDRGCSVVLVTHDPRVEDVADRILWLEDGAFRDRKAEQHSWVRDPVCGMRVDEWTATITTEYQDQRYLFCSAACLKRFEAEPSQYATRAET